MALELGQNLFRALHIFCHDHEFHVGPDLLHVPDRVQPVAAIEEKLRRIRILAAPHVDNAEVVPRVFVGIRFGAKLQPAADFVPVLPEVVLRLHVSVDQRVVRQCVQCRIRVGDVAPVRHVVLRVADEQARLLFIIAVVLVPVFLCDALAEVNIHEIHAPLRVQDVAEQLAAHEPEGHAVLKRDAPRRHITEKLVAEPLPGDKFCSDHCSFLKDYPRRSILRATLLSGSEALKIASLIFSLAWRRRFSLSGSSCIIRKLYSC